jgi:hypothetical protein
MENATLDPVLASLELPLRRTFYPLGYPLEIETNSPDVIAAASEGWGAFEQSLYGTPARLCLGVREGEGGGFAMEPTVRAREHMMSVVADPNNFVVCDFDRGFAFGWVTKDTAADHSLLRYHFLVAGGGSLVEQQAFAAMHGALVMRNGSGVMLAGESFAGKSTLAYACARAGWTYLSDDGTFLVRARGDRYAVGDPFSIRFRPDAPQLFSELADFLPGVRPNGKIAIEVLTSQLGLKTAMGCQIEHVVWLNREQPLPARLRPFPKQRMLDELRRYTTIGTRQVREAQRRCHERMLGAQLWEMNYSDLDDAVARLERLVDGGA